VVGFHGSRRAGPEVALGKAHQPPLQAVPRDVVEGDRNSHCDRRAGLLADDDGPRARSLGFECGPAEMQSACLALTWHDNSSVGESRTRRICAYQVALRR
jgi:hypothetical protein